MVEAGVRQAVLAEALPEGLCGYRPADGDGDLVVWNARRSVFEWVLRRAAAAEPGVDLRAGVAVTGLATEVNGTARVAGVVTDSGLVAADVVVDAAGKRSPMPGWVHPGGPPAPSRDIPCGITYLTRFYQLRDGEPGPLNRGFTHGASFDRYSCLVFPADNGAFSVTFGILPEDRALRGLSDPVAFQAAASAIAPIAPWVDPAVAEPTGGVALMASLHNLLRPAAPAEPVGLHALGDARCVTNPAHTRGTTLALVQAQHLAEVIDEHPRDPGARHEAMAAFTGGELAAWVEDSVAQDAARLARWRPDQAPSEPLIRHRLTNGEAYLAAQRDPAAWRSFTRLQNALVLPADVLDDPTMAEAVGLVRASGWSPAPSAAPDHDELVALITAACG
jgi:flavin-dependent dehydrogenase